MDRPVDANASDTQSSTVTEAIYTRLRTDILLGEWRPNDRLKLDRLRQRYAASVNTLREALSRLVSEGLVANEGQRGFKVVGASLADLQDITGMRAMLECHAARISIERADLDWESRVVGAYHKLSRVEELVDSDPEQYAPLLERYNREFHNALIANCGSKWLLVFHGVMYDQSLRYRMLAFKVTDFPREQSKREHKEILDAALARDAERLVKLLSAHIGKGAGLYAEQHLIEQEMGKPAKAARRGEASG
ncbi:transcriptional regulator, GntR family [Rhizobiales bacterium GAS113]|jgi:GntR family carbon starvation induced transcriptional regulator|nr:transcriptional regulator, GntR family [Rhizobiales bacterium GAS113]SED20383.1 transcriptional regulator, GntR family [Rhizobiales bacterium GAS188]